MSTYRSASTASRSSDKDRCDEFERRAHHYVSSPPKKGYTVRVDGPPAPLRRPLTSADFSRSPYVAAFFALDTARVDGTACIWAIRERAVTVGVTTKLKLLKKDVGEELIYTEAAEHLARELMEEKHPFVVFIEPHRLNERISIQQGLFLLPLALQPSLYETLLSTLDIPVGKFTPETFVETDRSPGNPRIWNSGLVKIEFPGAIRNEALKEMHLMNVSASTLYPGLEGFAKSLRTRLSIGAF